MTVIAIDGTAASGKGTLARNLSKELDFAYMDTGALYRAIAYEVLQNNKNPDKLELNILKEALYACDILQTKIQNESNINNILSNPEFRNEKIGETASKIAMLQPVRNSLISLQRSFSENPNKNPDGKKFNGAILDGRDIGSVICPNADLKLYIIAKDEIRAKRRMKELQLSGLDVTYSAVLEDMRIRDARDSNRKAAPLKPAKDSIIIDSSDLNEGQMLEKALIYVKKALG